MKINIEKIISIIFLISIISPIIFKLLDKWISRKYLLIIFLFEFFISNFIDFKNNGEINFYIFIYSFTLIIFSFFWYLIKKWKIKKNDLMITKIIKLFLEWIIFILLLIPYFRITFLFLIERGEFIL